MARALKNRERVLLEATIAVVALSMAYQWLALPLLKKNADLDTEIKGVRTRLARQKNLLAHKDEVIAGYKKLYPGFDMSALRSDTLVEVLGEVERLGNASGVKIVDVRPQSTQGDTPGVQVQIKAEGEMQQYFRFIYQLENSLYLLKIKRVQLDSLPGGSLLEGDFLVSQITSGG